MQSRIRRACKSLAASLSHLALVTPLIAVSAVADQNVALEEITVTAEKREANLQDIPIAISSFNQSALDDKGISDLQSVQDFVPSLQFTTLGNFTASPVVTLRGIGTDVTTSGADQGVALHRDGVYVGSASAGLLSFYDVERLEVLRGPQGTLYGRNATGGSINVITRKPDYNLEIFGDAMFGSYNAKRVRGVIGGGLSDTIAARLTVVHNERDGYLENLWPGGEDATDADEWNVRGQLLFDVNSSFEVIVRLSAADVGGVGAAMKTRAYPGSSMVGLIQPGPFAGTNIGIPRFANRFADALPVPESLREVRTDAEESWSQDVVGADITATWELESFTIKSITTWFDNETTILRDGDGSELPLIIKGRTELNEQYSQEFNISSNSDGKFEWLVGALFYHEERVDTNTFINNSPQPSVGGTGTLFTFDSRVEGDSWGLFGQASYFFTDNLRGTLGLRYSKDEKEGETVNRDIVDQTSGIHFINFPQFGRYGESWDEPTGKISIDYFIDDDKMLYFSYSKGYKSGGLNINAPNQAVFDPETIDAYEIGSKNRFWDNRFELNLSAFYYDYVDLQLFSVTESAPFIQNAGKSEITGLEIESKIAATENLQIDFYVAYLDSEIKDFVTKDPADPPPLQAFEDLSGNQLPRAPELSTNFNVSYLWELASGTLDLRAHYHWQDDMYFRAQNDADKVQKAYGTLGARLTYITADDRWRISAFGDNLSDEEAITGLMIEAGLAGSPIITSANDPRNYGIEVGYRFE